MAYLRYLSSACVIMAVLGCRPVQQNRVLLSVDTGGRYVRLTDGDPRYIQRKIGHIDGRPELEHLSDINGGLEWIFAELLGDPSIRVIVESKNKAAYRLVFPFQDRGVLPLVADALGVTAVRETREENGVKSPVLVIKDKTSSTVDVAR